MTSMPIAPSKKKALGDKQLVRVVFGSLALSPILVSTAVVSSGPRRYHNNHTMRHLTFTLDHVAKCQARLCLLHKFS